MTVESDPDEDVEVGVASPVSSLPEEDGVRMTVDSDPDEAAEPGVPLSDPPSDSVPFVKDGVLITSDEDEEDAEGV